MHLNFLELKEFDENARDIIARKELKSAEKYYGKIAKIHYKLPVETTKANQP